MAEMSEYIEQIKAANTGAEIRQPLADALKLMSEKGKDTSVILGNGGIEYTIEDFVLLITLYEILSGTPAKADAFPTYHSYRLASSDGIYRMIGDFDNVDWSD